MHIHVIASCVGTLLHFSKLTDLVDFEITVIARMVIEGYHIYCVIV